MTPYFKNFSDFLAMGGHGFYVWLCWGLVVFAVLFGILYIKHERQQTYKKITLIQARQQTHTKNHR